MIQFDDWNHHLGRSSRRFPKKIDAFFVGLKGYMSYMYVLHIYVDIDMNM